MRREQHDSHAAHKDEQHKETHVHADSEPRSRAFERNVEGVSKFSDDATVDPADADLAMPPATRDPTPVREAIETQEGADREVDQELAWVSGSSEAKYNSLKKEDTNSGSHAPKKAKP
ncbi:MAG TPA: hypothetical protein VGM77_10165 [Gemmatimonadales bacterium]|jgi:hypothetical protein